MYVESISLTHVVCNIGSNLQRQDYGWIHTHVHGMTWLVCVCVCVSVYACVCVEVCALTKHRETNEKSMETKSNEKFMNNQWEIIENRIINEKTKKNNCHDLGFRTPWYAHNFS